MLTPPFDPDLLVIVPSRARERNLVEFGEAFSATVACVNTAWIAAVDDDDNTPADPAISQERIDALTDRCLGRHASTSRTMNEALNGAALIVATMERAPAIIGFAGDDHRMRTPGWDKLISAELSAMGTGIVYGNDLFQGPNLPTAVFMTSDIVRALGWMAPPCLDHFYMDNWWLELGQRLQMIRYLDDVVIEHMHPEAGKGEFDEGYARVNEKRERDRIAYEEYKASGHFLNDVEKVRAIQVVR